MNKIWLRFVIWNLTALSMGCKDGYKETIERSAAPIQRHTENILSITSGRNVEIASRSEIEGKNQSSENQKSIKNLIRISCSHFYGSESSGEALSFLYDSSDFEEINLKENENRKVYYSSWAMFYRVQGICQHYRIHIEKMDSEKWLVNGFASCEIEEYGKRKIRKVQIKGDYRGQKVKVSE